MKGKTLLAGISIASLALFGCGGGGGGGGAGGGALNKSQAQALYGRSVSAIKPVAGLVEVSQSGAQANYKGGWLRNALRIYKSMARNGSLSPQQTPCDGGGTVEITYSSLNPVDATITFNNCRIYCDTTQFAVFNGTMNISGQDANGNHILENGSISLNSGFSYVNNCENESLYAEKDFSISVIGHIGQDGDIEDGNDNYKADLTLDGGPLKASEDSKWAKASFRNLTFYLNEYDPTNADYEWKINGSLTYVDNYCITDPVSVSFNTTNIFKGYNTVECEYTGRLSVNSDLIVAEAYDPDSNPSGTENYLKILFNGETVFDDLCTNFNPPDTCS